MFLRLQKLERILSEIRSLPAHKYLPRAESLGREALVAKNLHVDDMAIGFVGWFRNRLTLFSWVISRQAEFQGQALEKLSFEASFAPKIRLSDPNSRVIETT